ncbi:MAG: hypothetical protein ACWA42_01785 [Lutibacter sp.]
MSNEANRKSSLITSTLVVFLIAITPYLLYFYKGVSPDLTEYHSFFGTFKANYYGDMQKYSYYFFAKAVPLFLLLIWFATNKHWWVHILLVPISVYLFQLVAVLNDSNGFIDDIEFLYSMPFLIAVIVILYAIRYKLSIYVKAMDLKKEMDKKMENRKFIGTKTKDKSPLG